MSPAAQASETEREQLLVRAIMRSLGAARQDPARFYEMVMREETTRERIRTLPHQRVLFSFVMAHPRCVIRAPAGSSKTYTMTGLSLFNLGQRPTQRGAVISATQGQAQKVVGMVRDYIEQSVELRAVFPKLQPSTRVGDFWTQTKLVVDRPAGIRDPSLVAVGIDGALPGARLSWILVDDILDGENTATPAGNEHTRKWFASSVLSRRDVSDSRVVVLNTPWTPEDLTYYLSRDAKWPALTMDIEGDVRVENADRWLASCDLLRPSLITRDAYRMKAHDDALVIDEVLGPDAPDAAVDVEDLVPLWPTKFGRTAIDELREVFPSHEFNQLFKCICRDDARARVKSEWVEACKRKARELRHTGLVHSYRDQHPTFTGVDLAVGQTSKHDLTAFFTFAVLPSKQRLILDVEFGHFPGRQVIDRLIDIHARYNSIIRVENNAAQDFLLQWAREVDAMLPLRPHTTGRNKADPTHGVESIFIEIEKELWLIPNDLDGRVHRNVQRWLDDVMYYEPGKHTGDVLMASWLAREQARAVGSLAGRQSAQGALAGLMAR